VDPGPNYSLADISFDADYFYCHVEPELIVAKSCGSGDPAKGDSPNACHFTHSAVSAMLLFDHASVDCGGGDHPVDRTQVGQGSSAQLNFEAVSLEMSKPDYLTAPCSCARAGCITRVKSSYLRSAGSDAADDVGEQMTNRALCSVLMVLACLIGGAAAARAADSETEPEAFARIIVDAAELRTGPGVSYRVIYLAHRGETLAVDGRPSTGFWLRVLLRDGRAAYVLGDEVQPFAVTRARRERRRVPDFSRHHPWSVAWGLPW